MNHWGNRIPFVLYYQTNKNMSSKSSEKYHWTGGQKSLGSIDIFEYIQFTTDKKNLKTLQLSGNFRNQNKNWNQCQVKFYENILLSRIIFHVKKSYTNINISVCFVNVYMLKVNPLWIHQYPFISNKNALQPYLYHLEETIKCQIKCPIYIQYRSPTNQ